MSRVTRASSRPLTAVVLLFALLLVVVPVAEGQEIGTTEPDTAAVSLDETLTNNIAGEFTPSRGFDVIKTDHGSLNISMYGLFRYLSQNPDGQTYTDHLGRERAVHARNDLNWHRTMLWLTGYVFKPQLRYGITFWSLASTQQTLGFGYLTYSVSPRLTIGAGMAPNLTNRSMQGSHPFWASSDRLMSEEFFRGGFASGVFVRGELIDRLQYNVSVNTNLSQLGVTASNDSRDLAYSASLAWMPTTGEFGPRGGFGDLEEHEDLATKFGVSAAHAREDRAAPVGSGPKETQLRLSDGVLIFEEGALADGVTLVQADYDHVAVDAGFKLQGFCLQAEYFLRQLSDFDATGPLPDASITDHGFMAEAMHMVISKRLGVYIAGGYVFDEFKRNPWEVAGGASLYPYGSRSWRINLHIIHVEKSPASSNFGFYTAGQTGTTISIGTDIIL